MDIKVYSEIFHTTPVSLDRHISQLRGTSWKLPQSVVIAGFLKWVAISPLYFEATFEQQFLRFLLHRLVMQDSHHRQEPIISSCGLQASFVYTNIYWCFHKDFLLIKERLFRQHIFSHWFCFCKPSPNISSHFRQVSSNSKTNLFPNINYFVFICNFIKFHNLIVFYIEPAKLSITVSLFLHCSDVVQKYQFEEGSLKFTICLCWASEAFNHVSDIFTSDHSFPTLAVDNNFAAFCPIFASFQHSLLHSARLLHFFKPTSLSKFVMFSYFI